MRLQEIVLRTVRLPLIHPYVLSYRTFTEFEPIIVEVRDGDGRLGWGEGHISPGSSTETRDGCAGPTRMTQLGHWPDRNSAVQRKGSRDAAPERAPCGRSPAPGSEQAAPIR